MSEMKPTPGPWNFYTEPQPNGCPIVGNSDGLMVAMVAHSVNYQDQKEAALSDARLIAEAGTVFHNTGLSPVQLVEQRDELMAACKKLVEWDAREKDHAIGFMERINLCETAFQMMYAALAKCEGVE